MLTWTRLALQVAEAAGDHAMPVTGIAVAVRKTSGRSDWPRMCPYRMALQHDEPVDAGASHEPALRDRLQRCRPDLRRQRSRGRCRPVLVVPGRGSRRSSRTACLRPGRVVYRGTRRYSIESLARSPSIRGGLTASQCSPSRAVDDRAFGCCDTVHSQPGSGRAGGRHSCEFAESIERDRTQSPCWWRPRAPLIRAIAERAHREEGQATVRLAVRVLIYER
jgi:hypothetical protein